MITHAIKTICRSLDRPDEMREMGRAKLELVHLEDRVIARITLKPGWRWDTDIKPLVGTETCLVPHEQYVISGRLAIEMDDGTRFEAKAGDVVVIPPGHNAYVVGDEPVVAIDFLGMMDYGKPNE